MLPIREPTSSQLRYFGCATAIMLTAVAALFHYRLGFTRSAAAIVVFAIVLAVVYYAIPATQRAIYRIFMQITYPIQMTVTFVVLAIVYFGLLTPIGICLRWRGVDVRKPQEGESLWVERKSREPSDYFKTY